jgi:hypothetical protein
MKLRTRQIKTEHLFYLLAFSLALVLRLFKLGDAPLSDFESVNAIQSWYAIQGKTLNIGTNPGYFSLTSLLFYLFPVSNALARFWPALAGSLVVLAPYGFRRIFGTEAALIIVYGLALDPGMVALSRLAGGPMMAIGFGTLALAFIYNRKPIWAGITGGLALVSGTAVFSGLAGFLIASFVVRLVGFLPAFGTRFEAELQPGLDRSSRGRIRQGWVISAATILLVSTLFTRYPSGLGALGGGLENYIRGWITVSKTPVLQPVLAVIIYQPLALIFAIIAAVRGWILGEKISRWLAIWVLVVLVSTIIYPGRQVYDVAWALTPIWALAALELARYVKMPQPSTAAFGLAGVVLVLSSLFWLMSLNIVPGNFTWIIMVVVPLLIVLTTVLVGLGWSWGAARSGSILGFCIAAGLYMIAATIGTTQLRSNSPEELWTPPPGTVQAGLLVDTLEDLAVIQNGRVDRIDIVSTVEMPSLKWVLRNYSEVSYVSKVDPNLLSSVIITLEDAAEGSDLSQTMTYRGQDFVWWAHPGWSGALPPEWWKWVTTRQAPLYYESLVLWARADFFPEQSVGEPDHSELVPAENDVVSPNEGSVE